MNDKLRAVALAGLMVLSVGIVPVSFSGSSPVGTASAATTDNFHIVDAGNSGGQTAIVVEANTTDTVDDFQFYYEEKGKSRYGPYSYGDSSVSAKYPNGSKYDPSTGISASNSTPDRAIFTLGSGNTPYVENRVTLNATANGNTYSGASDANKDVATMNWQHVTPKASDGSTPAGVVPFDVRNADTNESLGNIFAMSGDSAVVMCRGVEVDGTCTDPETGSTATHTEQAWSAGEYGLGSNTDPPRWKATSPVALTGYNLAQSNTTKRVTGPGTTTVTSTRAGAPVFIRVGNATDGSGLPVDSLTVTNLSSGNVVYESDGQPQTPAFLKPATRYKVEITHSQSYGTETRYLTVPTKGMTMATLLVNTDMAESTVTGQLVDEQGNPVQGAVVMAERSGASSMGYRFYNSTVTDSNGLFSVSVPESSAFQYPTEYQLTSVSGQTNGGTLKYYPTTADNGGDGYKVRSSKTVVPQLTIKNGGKVSVDLTQNGGGSIEPAMLTTTLGKYTGRTGERTRSAVSESFNQISFGQSSPTSAEVSLMSPTTGTDTRVGYDVWSVSPTQLDSRPKWVCSNGVAVSQGSTTDSSCAVSQAAYINLSVDQYGSIVQQSSATAAQPGDFGFFYENELVVRDSSTGDVVTYLGGGSGQIFNLGTGPTSAGVADENVTIPVPAGNDYELELRPADDWVRQTTVNDTTTVSVSAGSTTDVTLDRGRDFGIRPVHGRSSGSLTRSADNTFAVNVTDPVTRKGLTATEVSTTVHFAYTNGTQASARVDLTENTSTAAGQGVFDTTTLKPSSLDLDAGTYDLVVTASHASGSRTYNTTETTRVQVSDFQTAIDLSSNTVAPGDKVVGTIKAYDTSTSPPSGIDATKSNVDIEVYDENGNLVASKNPSSDVSSGEGSFSVSMPNEVGAYRVVTFVDTGAGKQGIAERWVRVSKFDVEVSTDKRTYAPDETVQTDVSVTDATDGSAVSNATVEVTVNGNTVGGTTDSNGELTVPLDPASFASSDSAWQDDTFVRTTVYKDTSSGVFRKTAGTGFRVQSFDVRASPVSSTFTSSDSVVLDVGIDSGVSVSDVTVTSIDGEPLDTPVSGTEQSAGYYQVDVGTQPVGQHVATVTVETADSRVETTKVQYAVRSNSIAVDTNKFTYNAKEDIAVDVTVRDTSGNAVSGESVSATLYAAESPPRQVGSAVSDTTGTDGTVTLSGLSSSSSGLHFVEVDVAGQKRYKSLMVSNLSATFEDGSDSQVTEYQAEPGTTKTVYVDGTTGGSAVADGTTVQVGLLAYGELVAHSNAEISNGQGDTAVDISVPSDLSAGTYTLVTRVQTADGNIGSTSTTLNVTGGSALDIEADTGDSRYAPGETATFTSTVTDASGSPVSGKPVVFTLDTEGSTSKTLGTAQTGSDGAATIDYSVPSDASNGEYVIETSLADAGRTKDYRGFTISSLDAEVTAAKNTYEPGETISLTANATDAAGNAVDADSGELRVVMPSGNEITTSFSTSGTAPYSVDFTVPNDDTSVGDLTISARVKQGQATATGSTLATVESSSESASLAVPDTVTSGEPTDLTLSSSVSTSGTVTVFSPDTSTVAVDRSVSLSANSNTTESVTLSSPGTYVFKLSVPDVGTVTEIRTVQPSSSNDPSLTVGTSVGDSTDAFSTSEDVYLQSDTKGTTVTVISDSESYEVSLNQKQGDTYYGVLSESRSAGPYLVRLDSDRATGVNKTIIRVEP